MSFHPFKECQAHTAGAAQAELGIPTSYLLFCLGRSTAQRQLQLRLWLPFTHQLSGAQDKNHSPSIGLSFSTQEALQVDSRLASSVDKGDRSDSVTVPMVTYGYYVLSTNAQKLFDSSPWLFQTREDLVSISIISSTKIKHSKSSIR